MMKYFKAFPDKDGDGLNDAHEKNLGTNPCYYDTDWDGPIIAHKRGKVRGF